MFTVCPKCALTLVVTAADLRVAQGYVRCGRCSNVFNALARLSEDRQAAANQAQASPAPAPAPNKATSSPAQADPSATSRSPQIPRQPAPDPSPTAKMRQAQDTSSTASLRKPPPTSPPAAQQRPAKASSPEPKRYDDNSAPEEDDDLEFNPEATDITKVFVEQAPSPEFKAATGTFKALKLEAEDLARQQHAAAESPPPEPFDPVDTQVDVEIDPDLLAAMAALTNNRLERLNLTPVEHPPVQNPPLHRPTSAPPPQFPSPTSSAGATAPPTSASATAARPVPTPPVRAGQASATKAAQPARHPPLTPPQMEQPATTPSPPMRLAQRAKARLDAARPTSLETAQAIKAALTPRRRQPTSLDADRAAGEPTTSFYAGMWGAGSAVLTVLLLVQIVHHYRHDLAATATLNRPLTYLYSALDIPLIPRWNVGAYEVRQLGASTAAEAPGQITVRASVKNAAHQAQPMPLLRVTLQDRFGNRIAARDVPPQSYLPRAIPGSSLLSAGQRIDAEMAFVDPGSNAVGFEIDACLPAPGGGVTCASDAAR